MSIFIVAEIGINHNGDMSVCKKLIDVAIDSSHVPVLITFN